MNRLTTFILTLGFGCAVTAAGRADFVVPSGETLRDGVAGGHVAIHGAVVGELDEPLTFGADSRVSGSGYFENTLALGVFAPGNSPGITTGANQAFGSTATIEFELGGLTPGFFANHHDQINDSATIALVGGPTLKILPYGGFVPQIGDEFVVMTWGTGLSGSFGATVVDSYFTTQGLTFAQEVDNPGGAGTFTLVVMAVPETTPLLLLSGAGGLLLAGRALIVRRRR